MIKRNFSTGLPAFDHFVGGCQPGDSLVFFVSHTNHVHDILSPLIAHLVSANIPLIYLSIDDSLQSYVRVHPNHRQFPLQSKKGLNRVKRFLASHAQRSCVIMDDLAKGKSIFSSDRAMASIIQDITNSLQRKKAFLCYSVTRSEFSGTVLAQIKDVSTLCFDIIQHQDVLYCLPLSLKGRYVQHDILPLKFNIRDLKKSVGNSDIHSTSPGGDPDISKQQQLMLEKLNDSLLINFENVFRESNEAMLMFDLHGNYRIANKRCEEFLGIRSEEFKRINPLSLVVPKDRISVLRFLAMLKKKKNGASTFSLSKKNGKHVSVEIHVSNPANVLFFGILRDVSERQKTEHLLHQREAEYRLLLDSSPGATLLLHHHTILYANGAFFQTFVYDPSEDISHVPLKQLFLPEGVRKIQKVVRETINGTGDEGFTTIAHRKDGSQFNVGVKLTKVLFGGNECVLLSMKDITQEQALIKSLSNLEERYRVIVERSSQPVAILRADGFVFANKTFLVQFGHETMEGIVGHSIASLVVESERAALLQKIHKRSSSRSEQLAYECKALRKNGTSFPAEMILTSIKDTTVGDTILVLFDRTDQKKITEELQRQSEEVELLRHVLPAIQSTLDFRKLPHLALNKLMEVFSWGIGAMYLADDNMKELHLAYHRNLPDEIVQKLDVLQMDEGIGGYCSKTQEPHVFLIEQYPSFLPHRALFKGSEIRELCFLPLVAGDSLVGLILLATKKEPLARKESPTLLSALGNNLGSALINAKALYQIRESERRKEQLIQSSPEILYTASPSGAFISVNATIERLVGYTPKEFYRTSSLWLKLVNPDDKRILLERTTNLDTLGNQTVHEYRVLPKGKAAYRWVRDALTIVKDGSGSVIDLFGTITDITDQKMFVDDLQTENVLQSEILSGMQDGVIAFDRSLMCISWNPAMERMTGIEEEAAFGKAAASMLPGYEVANLDKLLGRALDGETVTSPDIAFQHFQTGATGYFLGRFSPMKNQQDEIVGVVGIIVDVSAHKVVETEVRQSEQILSNVIDTMGDILLITDLRGRVLQVNRAFLRVLGYSRADAIGSEFPYPWLIEKEMGRFVLWISNLREHNWLHDFDMTWGAKDGRQIPMSLSTTLLRNSLGEPIAMLNIARDITERNRLAKDLENRNKQIEMINRIIGKVNQTHDFDEIFTIIAKEIHNIIPADFVSVGLFDEYQTSIKSYTLMGKQTFLKTESIPVHQTISQSILETQQAIIIPDFHADQKYQDRVLVAKGLRSQVLLPIQLKGHLLGTLTIGSTDPHIYSEEHLKILEPIAQQTGSIIDRIQLFNQVTDDAAYIHNLLDSIDSIVYTVDTQFRIREVNKAWHEFMLEFGAKPVADYHGMNLFDVLASESLRAIYHRVLDLLLNGTLSIFSEEFVQQTSRGERTYQLMINPMVIDKKITGLVFTHTDITALKKTGANLKKNNEQLLALNEISAVMSTSLDLQEILLQEIHLLQSMTGADAVIFYLKEEGSGDLVLAKQLGFESEKFPSILRLKHNGSATGDVITKKQALYIADDIYLDERITSVNREVLRQNGMRAMTAIPLVAKDKVLGALDIFYKTAHEISDQEQQILTLVGNQLGAVIENAQLYSELRSQIHRLTVLYDFSQQLTSTLNIDEIFQIACDHIQHIVPFRTFKIDLYDERLKTKTPVFNAVIADNKNIRTSVDAVSVIVDPESIDGIAIASKNAYRSEDKKTISIPMMSKEMIIGIMTVEADQPTIYRESHLKLFESISNLTAIALEKGKLYDETLQKSSEIERRNKELDDFTYVVSHDLKEPLISIEGFSRILQSDYHDSIQQEGKEYFESIVGATTRMKGLIDDLLLLSRISRPSESFKHVSIRSILEEISSEMEFTIKQKGVSFRYPQQLPVVNGNETQLKIVFRNLIGNAIKFNGKPGPTVEIGFQNAENNAYLFSVKDNGIGIDKEFHEKIFVIFQRLHRREDYEGSGAGLAIVKKIIEIHKGKIWVESELGKGSTFFFAIPSFILPE